MEATGYILDIDGNVICKVDSEKNTKENGLTHSGHLKTGEFKQSIEINFEEIPENGHILAFEVKSP